MNIFLHCGSYNYPSRFCYWKTPSEPLEHLNCGNNVLTRQRISVYLSICSIEEVRKSPIVKTGLHWAEIN